MSTTFMQSVGLAAAMLASTSVFAADSEHIERGRYLATAGDCVACHSAPGGKPMAGGLALASPFWPIARPTHAFQGARDRQLHAAAVQRTHCATANVQTGPTCYPAMPYTEYAKTSDEDIAAMYAYFMQGVEAVDAAPAHTTALPFPFNIRASLGVWNALFHDATPYQADASQTPEWNRGAYLSQGLAHCTTCHTPRTTLMAEDSKRSLGGGEVGGWYAPNITSDAQSGIGNWTVQELVQYMSGQPVPGKAQWPAPWPKRLTTASST